MIELRWKKVTPVSDNDNSVPIGMDGFAVLQYRETYECEDGQYEWAAWTDVEIEE